MEDISDNPIKILLVEDNPGDARLIKEMLSESTAVRFELVHVKRLSEARESLAREGFDIIVLDLSLPDGHGLDTVVQTHIAAPGIPLVIMSGLGKEELAIKAVQEGAQNYLIKGQVDSDLLVRSMRYAIERKQAEEELRRAYDEMEIRVRERTVELARTNRALKMLNECNRIIVRATNELDLLGKICRTVVALGGYRLAWVGFAEQGKEKAVRPTAQAGCGNGYLETISIAQLDTERGLSGEAIRTGKPCLVRDILNDSNFVSWRSEESRYGYISAIAVPLISEGQALGVLNVYAGDPSAFESDEIKLLTELADNVAYALSALRSRKERKRMVETLQESEARFRAIFETAQDSIFIKDRALRYIHVNPAMEKLFGLPFSKLIKMTDEDLFGEEAGKHIMEIDSRVLRGEIIEEEHTKPVKGVPITFHVIKVPIRDSSGEIIGLCGIARDITERKEAEKALQDSKAKYAAIVEGFDGFIYICSENYEIEFMNERLIERTGYNALGQRCYKTLYGLDETCQWCENEKIIRGEVVRGEIRGPKDNRWYYIVNTPIHNQNGSISRMTMIQDITEKKENEIRLIMTERLAALGQMAFGIAHEINNPLATIAACAEGLLNRLKKWRYNPELFEGYLRIIEEEVIRCKSITTSMLSFVRKTNYEKKYIDINYMLDKTLELISFQGRFKEVKVIRNYKGELIVYANEGELRQVFLIFIVNALDAMEDRGTLTIETGIIPPTPPLEKGGEEGMVFIKIGDTGSGISPELIDRIFDPFFTTKSEKGGIGLGLSLAKKMITDNNGNIDVTSEQGKGTIFKITLPL
jgi:two-component system cell cycle sensor histidine kinase/response regulator CckA